MTELQAWLIVGVYALAIIGMPIWQGHRFDHALRTSLDGLQHATDARLEAINTRLEAVNTRLDALDRKIDALARGDSA